MGAALGAGEPQVGADADSGPGLGSAGTGSSPAPSAWRRCFRFAGWWIGVTLLLADVLILLGIGAHGAWYFLKLGWMLAL